MITVLVALFIVACACGSLGYLVGIGFAISTAERLKCLGISIVWFLLGQAAITVFKLMVQGHV